MIRCPTCGQENPDGFAFCGACGNRLAPAEPAPEEERKVVTALFTDIVGSTAAAAALDPEDVHARLAPYYARVRRELEAFGGTVEKFIGDAVVAVFGAPVAHEDDPERAVHAALAITRAVAELNEEDSWLDLHIRTAVHTGEALVVPSARAVEGEGLASGDVMNTAARIQGGAPVDGIAVGEATYRATAHLFEYEKAAAITAKGKAEPVPIWIVAGRKAPGRPAPWRRLVGRGEELERLVTVWERACAESRPQLVTVLGAAGIGKSRLLVELGQRIDPDARMYWGRCLSYGEGITYWPVAEIIKGAAGIRHDDDAQTLSRKLGDLLESLASDERDELRTMAAAAANLLGAAATPQGTYQVEEIGQAELHWGIRRILELLALQAPLLLVFEDLHWAEPTLLELLLSLLDVAGPLAVVATARPELAEENAAFMLEEEDRHLVVLGPLERQETEQLLGELVGTTGLDLERLGLLLANAGGNPLFLEETVRMLADTDLLEAGTAIESLPIPDSLQALIGARLDGLPTGDKAVAQQASVVGAVFWLGAVAHLAGADRDPSGPIATLERRDFVYARPESAIAGDREFEFKHILIRDVAYERLPKGRRAELHALFVEWLRGISTAAEDEFLEVVAYHLEQACLLARSVARSPIEPPVAAAADALARAGEKAERRGGMREADRYYVRALELLDDRRTETALDLRVRRALTRNRLGEVTPAVEDLFAAAADAAAAGQDRIRGDALAALGQIELRLGHVVEARGFLTEAHDIARRTGDRTLEVRAVYRLSALTGDFDGELEQAVADAGAGLRLAEELGDRTLQIEGHLRLAFFLENLGELAGAEEELERCLELSRETGSLRDDARATYLLGLVRYYRGDAEDAERLGLQAREWFERIGETFMATQNLLALARYAMGREDAALAERWLQEALPVALEGGGFVVVQAYRQLVEALVHQGRIDDARELLDFARRDAPAEDPYAVTQVLLAEASLAGAAGALREALRAYAEAVRLLDEQQLVVELAETRLEHAAILRRLGDATAAQTELLLARDRFAAIGAKDHVTRIEAALRDLAGEGTGVTGPLAQSP